MTVPLSLYGWAERNTRPSVPSNERQRHKLNGLLCVDALSGEECLRLSDKAKTEDISLYLAELCLDCIELGFDKLSLVLDNNTTRKQKMRKQLIAHLPQMGRSNEIKVELIYLPADSRASEFTRICHSSDSITIFAPFTDRHFFAGH